MMNEDVLNRLRFIEGHPKGVIHRAQAVDDTLNKICACILDGQVMPNLDPRFAGPLCAN